MKSLRLPLAAVASVVLLAFSSPASAESSIVTKSGSLYEVFVARFGDVFPWVFTAADDPVVMLRTTAPGQPPSVDVVEGSITPDPKGSPSVEVDETTGAVLVCYTRYLGLMSDLKVAVKRDGQWVARDIAPNEGFFLSLNPKLAVSRQKYIDSDGHGGTVTKTRTIFSLVWWEESGPAQARYAPIFVEDGILKLDDVTAYDLVDLVGASGVTHAGGLPFSAYQFPAVEPDPSSANGGVLVVFTNLVTMREDVVGITFPDDMTKLGGTSVGTPPVNVRAHMPIGREIVDRPIPAQRDVQSQVDYFIAPSGLATSWWTDGTTVFFLRNDAPAGEAPKALSLRTDLTVDRAIGLVRAMTLKGE